MYFKVLRSLLFYLITFQPTYLLGMVIVRFTRKTREKRSDKKEHVVISNFMGNIKMYLDKNSYMGGAIYRCGFHHINELLFLKSYLTPEMTFVDIGANQGEFSMFACSKLTIGKVIAFEPTIYQLGLLKKNVSLNEFKNIEVNEYGLLDKNDTLDIYTSYDVEIHGGTHEGLSTLYKSEERNKIECTIDLKVFDKEYFHKLERLDVVKIDIEGAELFALRGMEKSLEKFRPRLIIEMNEATFQSAGYKLMDVIDFLDKFNYVPFKIYRGKLIQINSNKFESLSNVVFISAQ